MANSSIKERYAVVGASAYKVLTKVEAGKIKVIELHADYPGGSTKLDLEPGKAQSLIDSMHRHAVSKIDYEAQIIRNKQNNSPVQKRAV
tara:strand:- start:5738 stop:6004 length:267 start_codon:yes stop_codon:yes gene_type:complete